MQTMRAEEFRRRRRNFGTWIPPAEVEIHLCNGWEIADDCAEVGGTHDVLMRPPAAMREAAE
jgi:hypothetical protein